MLGKIKLTDDEKWFLMQLLKEKIADYELLIRSGNCQDHIGAYALTKQDLMMQILVKLQIERGI